jgi:uncharacterized protein involved in copper resistance
MGATPGVLTLPAEGTKFRAMTSFRRAAVCLALAAMMLRALMPAGWMPNPAGAGDSFFVICDMDQGDMPGMDMSAMDMSKMDMSGMDHGPSGKHSGDAHQHEACPFAAAPHVATPSAEAALLLPSLLAKFSPLLAQGQAAIKAALYTPQSPRGPPVSI